MNEGIQILKALDEMKALLAVLAERQMVKDHFQVEEFAALVGRSPWTVRAWCRHGRIRAEKRLSGRSWVVSLSELRRYQKEGLLLSHDVLQLGMSGEKPCI